MARRSVVTGAIVLIACVLATGPAPAGDQTRDQDDAAYRQRILDARTAAKLDAHARAGPLFEVVIADARFGRLPQDEQRPLLSAAAWSAAYNGDLGDARAWYAQLATLGSDAPDDWYRMALVALDLGDRDAAARAMTVLVARWPELLRNVTTEVLYPLALQGDTATPDRVAFQQALFDANWKGGSAGDPGSVWFQLSRSRLVQGDRERARIVARRITDPETLVLMRADRRFDPLLDPDSWRANVPHANTREIARMRLLTRAHPDRIESLGSLVRQLLVAGRHEEVLAVADGALARIASAPENAPPFVDLDQQVWLMNYRAIALRRMGRIDEAADELRRASRLTERGAPNVSQMLNLGSLECDRGHAEAALAAADAAAEPGLSAYGRAVRAVVRHCAAHQLGDQAAAAAQLDELAGLVDDAPLLYVEALLLAGQADNALALMRELLASDSKRSLALGWAQDCRRPEPLPAQAEQRARRKAFLAREDVLEAISAVGRIESYPVYCRPGG